MAYLQVGQCKIEIIKGDITEEETDAIVNAANEGLTPGGGVDGAIHRKGGPSILEELKAKYTRCPTGHAVVTRAGNLKAKYVIHAVGPVYRDGKSGEAELLASAYRSALERALELGISSISFPALSTGAYGYPMEEASYIALKTVHEFLTEKNAPKLVKFVLFTEEAYQTFVRVLERLREEKPS